MTSSLKTKTIMLRFTKDEYTAIRAIAFSRGLDMGPMLIELLRPTITLLTPPEQTEPSAITPSTR